MNHPKRYHAYVEALLSSVSPDEAVQLREVWELAGDEDPLGSPKPEEVEHALGRLNAALGPEEQSMNDGRRGRIDVRRSLRKDRRPREEADTSGIRRTAWRGWAAPAALLLLAGLALFWWFRPVEHVAPPGERLAIRLPDGSRVELNSGARLRYARWFGQVRIVHLAGEAFFDVAEEKRPFVVETFNAEIRVLGTRFGVRAWPGGLDRGTTVALKSGRVALAPAGQPERVVTMAPGETRRVAGGTSIVSPYPLAGVSVEDATAWRRGDLVFKDQLLGVILEDVERRFAVDVQVNPLSLRQKRLSLAWRRPTDAETIVRDLAVALSLRYREISNGYELFEEAPSPR